MSERERERGTEGKKEREREREKERETERVTDRHIERERNGKQFHDQHTSTISAHQQFAIDTSFYSIGTSVFLRTPPQFQRSTITERDNS